MSEQFVVRTRDGSYIGPLGNTRKVDQAVRFDSRMGALGMCADLGAVMDQAQIRPFSEEKRLQEAVHAPAEAEGSPDV